MGFNIQTCDGELPFLNEFRVWESGAVKLARKHMAKYPEFSGQIIVSRADNHDIVLSLFRNEKWGEVQEEEPLSL